MSNIDSRIEPEAHDRFKIRSPLIQLLRKIVFDPSFSANC
jgi:hypothetical protein